METNRLFFLNNIGGLVNNKKLNPSQIYLFYHNKISEKQQQKFNVINPILDIIDQHSRRINVVTNDETELSNIREKIILLSTIDREIRNQIIEQDAKFLSAIKDILNYKFNS